MELLSPLLIHLRVMIRASEEITNCSKPFILTNMRDIENISDKLRNEAWKVQGNYTKIKYIDTRHLLNILKYLQKAPGGSYHNKSGVFWILAIETELQYRRRMGQMLENVILKRFKPFRDSYQQIIPHVPLKFVKKPYLAPANTVFTSKEVVLG